MNVHKAKGPVLSNLTAHVDSIGNMLAIKSSTRSINAGETLALPADEDGASAKMDKL